MSISISKVGTTYLEGTVVSLINTESKTVSSFATYLHPSCNEAVWCESVRCKVLPPAVVVVAIFLTLNSALSIRTELTIRLFLISQHFFVKPPLYTARE